jgi:phage host-nuclease inhibitor protein Gam
MRTCVGWAAGTSTGKEFWMATPPGTKKKAAPATTAPKNLEDAKHAVSQIAAIIRSVHRIEAKYDADVRVLESQIARARKQQADKITPLMQQGAELANALHLYAEKNKDDLTNQGKKKTVRLSTGDSFRWRTNPLSAIVSDADALIEELEAHGLKDAFTKTTVTIRKKALIDSRKELPSDLTHVSFSSREKFEILPKGMDERFETILTPQPRRWEIRRPDKKKA